MGRLPFRGSAAASGASSVHVDLQVRSEFEPQVLVRVLFCHLREPLSPSAGLPIPCWHVDEQGALRVPLLSTDPGSRPTPTAPSHSTFLWVHLQAPGVAPAG